MLNVVCDMKFWIVICNLVLVFVVDDLGDNVWVIFVFFDYDFELMFKFGLFGISWLSIGVDFYGRYVLYD